MPPPTLDGSFEPSATRLELGRQRRLGPQQGPAGSARQHQRRQPRPRSGPGRGLHRALRAVQHLRRRGVDHPADAGLSSPSPSGTAAGSELWDFSANITGGLFDLPGGAAGIAIGVEHRDQSGRFDPDPIVAAGLGSDIPALPTSGGYNVDEAYAELRLPLLRDTPFFHRLELTGAARYSDYSTSGSTDDLQAGINWEPIEDLLFRGSWAEGFRAPEHRRAVRHAVALRPGDRRPLLGLRQQRRPATVRANCIADGVPANGSYVQLNPQLPVVTGGNQISTPESSESWGVGAVWRPELPAARLSLEANYFNIKVDGAIQAIDAEHPARPLRADRRRAELRRDRPHRLGRRSRRSAACCRTSPASRPTAST